MKSAWLRSSVALAALTLLLSAPGRAQGTDYSKIQLRITRLAPALFLITGSPNVDVNHPDAAGGAVGVLTGPDGTFLVDSQYAQISDKLLATVKTISDGPIRFLVNTHIHPDHTAGNAFFGKLGATIFSRDQLRGRMIDRPAGANAPARDPAGVPTVTYDQPVQLHLNGEVVHLIPIRAAHTDGDTIVRFERADAIFIGDFYRAYGYPFIDRNNGGTLKGMLDGIDMLMTLAGPTTRLVPGHGAVTTRAALVPYRNMMIAVRDKVEEMIRQNKTEQEVLAAKLTAPFDARTPGADLRLGPTTSADRFVSAVYAELKPAR
jgi:glyoxylase-like metal-dependent hydrolase (beta-lactamase superfamily II)